MPRASTVLMLCLSISVAVLIFRAGMRRSEVDMRYRQAEKLCAEQVLITTKKAYVCIRTEAILHLVER